MIQKAKILAAKALCLQSRPQLILDVRTHPKTGDSWRRQEHPRTRERKWEFVHFREREREILLMTLCSLLFLDPAVGGCRCCSLTKVSCRRCFEPLANGATTTTTTKRNLFVVVVVVVVAVLFYQILFSNLATYVSSGPPVHHLPFLCVSLLYVHNRKKRERLLVHHMEGRKRPYSCWTL